MKQVLYSLLFGVLASVVVLAGSAQTSQAAQAEKPSVLIQKDELQATARKLRIIDVRPAKDYEAGHIPGAIHLERKAFEDPNAPVDGTIATPEQINRLLSNAGIANDDALVVYSSIKDSPQMASRFWWVMDIYGHKNVRVLDGGIEGWTASGGQLAAGKGKALPKADYHVRNMDLTQLAFKDDVLNRASGVVLLDVRTPKEYDGSVISEGAGRGGRIPGAVHLFFKDSLDENGFFKSPEALKTLFASRGITADTDVIVYCMRAHRASSTIMALRELLGYQKVRGYNGSWIEWSNIPSLPLETGAK